MNWAQVKSLTIPEGVVSKVTSAGAVIWQKAKEAVMEWTQSNVTSGTHNISFGNGVWVATGYNAAYYSEDGKTWTRCVWDLSGVASAHYVGGLWIGGSTTNVSPICCSEDGKTWVPIDVPKSVLSNVAYSKGRYCASCSSWLYSSVDGKAWTKTGDASFVAATDDYFLACRITNDSAPYIRFFYSDDGFSWVEDLTLDEAFSGKSAPSIKGLSSVGIGIAITSGTDTGGVYSRSQNPATANWTAPDLLGATPFIKSVNGSIFAVQRTDSNDYFLKLDGTHFVPVHSGMIVNDVAASANMFVASASDGLYFSEDGDSWTRSEFVEPVKDVAFADGLFVAGTNNGSLYSTDGKHWTQSNVESVIMSSIMPAAGVWVASAEANGLYWSDGLPEETA